MPSITQACFRSLLSHISPLPTPVDRLWGRYHYAQEDVPFKYMKQNDLRYKQYPVFSNCVWWITKYSSYCLEGLLDVMVAVWPSQICLQLTQNLFCLTACHISLHWYKRIQRKSLPSLSPWCNWYCHLPPTLFKMSPSFPGTLVLVG